MGALAWAEKVFEAALDDPAGRVQGIEHDSIDTTNGPAARITIAYSYEDSGGTVSGSGRIFLPSELETSPGEQLPLVFSAGYEVPDEQAPPVLEVGRILATTITPPEGPVSETANPLSRGPNLDIVLLHLTRALRCVDRSRIVIQGGSAGGYMTLMLAAESFPVAAAVAVVPPVNLGYELGFGIANAERATLDDGVARPYVHILNLLAKGAVARYGDDPASESWFLHSPVAHLERITAPVSAIFSTADMLVPIEQVGGEFAIDPISRAPQEVLVRREDVGAGEYIRTRLFDALDPADVDLNIVAPPAGARILVADPENPPELDKIPLPSAITDGRRWSVTIIDEGPPMEPVGHFLHALAPDSTEFCNTYLTRPLAVEQLDAPKLDLLLDRYSGREWIAPGFSHLDDPRAERLDVEQGLRTYCQVSPAHADRFRELYARVPEERRCLDQSLVDTLQT